MIFSNKDASSPSGKSEPIYQKTGFWIFVLILLVLIILFQHFPFFKKKKIQTIPVVTAVATRQDVPVYLSELGGVTPTSSITVRTQINGQLIRVLFKEGQIVKKGDLLAEIDPRPYEAQLMQYQGQLMRDQALLANAKIDLTRYGKLWKEDSIAKQTLDTQGALVQQYQGAVMVDQGLIKNVQVNLIYTRITSPVDGRIGLRLVDAGNFVQTSDVNGIAVVATLSPITVIFSIPEDSVPDVLEQVNAGNVLTVKAYDRQQNKLLAVGTLLTMDNQIDPTTGTVKLRAEFKNENNTLFPNQFVNVLLLVKTLNNAIVIPTAAVQHGPKNTFVYVLNKDNTVSVKPVVIGVATGDKTVITSGIDAGQIVVTEGTDKLTEGAAVTAVSTIDTNQRSAL